MKKQKPLFISFAVVILCALTMPWSVLGDEGISESSVAPPSLDGNWSLTVNWIDPPDWDTVDMEVIMETSFSGYVQFWVWEGFYDYGAIFTDGTSVLWTYWWTTFYFGTVFSPDFMGGFMIGTDGDYGVWHAYKLPWDAQ